MLFRFGSKSGAAVPPAQQALAVIRHFGFDGLCRVGHGEHALRILVKSR